MDNDSTWLTLSGWILVSPIGTIITNDESGVETRSRIDEWRLGRRLQSTLEASGLPEAEAEYSVAIIKLLTVEANRYALSQTDLLTGLHSLLQTEDAQQAIGVHGFESTLWFNKEQFEQTLWWLYFATLLEDEIKPAEYSAVTKLHQIAQESNYQFEKLMQLLQNEPEA